MIAQDPRKEDHNALSADLSGSCVRQGSFREGSKIVFTVHHELADIVYLVGSFNGWSESNPMKKTGSGIWQTELSDNEIQDGDAYKFKVVYHGIHTYIADPYAVENEGAPHFNSVFRDLADELTDSYKKEEHTVFFNRPLNVLSICADVWSGGAHSYSDIARELIPYMMQMGYTHLCMSGVFEEYYEFSSGCNLKANFAPRKEQGGIDELRQLVHLLHASGIGVLLDRGVTAVSYNEAADQQFLADDARYWLDLYGFDGLVSSAASEGSAKMLSRVYRLLKREYENAYFFDRGLCGVSIPDADAVLCDLNRVFADFVPTENETLKRFARMAAMSYLLVSEGKGITEIGCELGISSEEALCGVAEVSAIQEKEDRTFQLYVSDLNAVYLSNPCLWNGESKRIVKKQQDAVTVECKGEDCTVIFIADTSGRGCEIDITSLANPCVKLDSCIARYGGKKCDDGFRISRDKLLLEPYEAVVILGE